MTAAGPGWRRSSFCSDGTCAEIAIDDTAVLVRHSTEPDLRMTFSHAEWQAFLKGAKNNEFEVSE